MNTSRPFQQIDVFGSTFGDGNPLAVVLDGTGLDDAQMQRFARWTNLSETVFLLPPSDAARAQGADYKVRIFTPTTELGFAGHPTLGSCHAWLQAGGRPQRQDCVAQECAVGLVQIQKQDTIHAGSSQLAFAAPPLMRSTPSPELVNRIAQALGLPTTQIKDVQILNNGTEWVGLWLEHAHTVLALEPDHNALKALGYKVGVAGSYQADSVLIGRSSREAQATRSHTSTAQESSPLIEVRAFAASAGIVEDPATGSLNASLAQWLIASQYVPAKYVAAQGQCIGRNARLYISLDAQGQVWVGGQSFTRIQGHVTLT